MLCDSPTSESDRRSAVPATARRRELRGYRSNSGTPRRSRIAMVGSGGNSANRFGWSSSSPCQPTPPRRDGEGAVVVGPVPKPRHEFPPVRSGRTRPRRPPRRVRTANSSADDGRPALTVCDPLRMRPKSSDYWSCFREKSKISECLCIYGGTIGRNRSCRSILRIAGGMDSTHRVSPISSVRPVIPLVRRSVRETLGQHTAYCRPRVTR